MEHSKLSQHTWKKGRLVTPFNRIENISEVSWFKDYMPEYIWIGLIIDSLGRRDGLDACGLIINYIKSNSIKLDTLRLSELLSLKEDDQISLLVYIRSLIGNSDLDSLTILFTYTDYPVFSKMFNSGTKSYEERLSKIGNIIKEMSDHQSYLSTDVRFIVLWFEITKGKMHFLNGTGEGLPEYPYISHNDVRMRFLRPSVRSNEMAIRGLHDKNNLFLDFFWENISRMIDCKIFYIEYEKENVDADVIIDKYKSSLEYYSTIFTTTSPFDEKMEVLLGIATYSFKRFSELVRNNLYNTIVGRSIIRVLIEDYIMMKYLLNGETSNQKIWNEYKQYGIGQYKLIALRQEEKYARNDLDKSHVQYNYLHLLVNEFKDEELIDMDTNYFNKDSIREKAIAVNEKELFDLYYDYDSAFEHGLWGAIRESSMLRCDEPCHQYHLVPDVDENQNMKSVWDDCLMVMDKTFSLLDSLYGSSN